jgi:hypothetical protein
MATISGDGFPWEACGGSGADAGTRRAAGLLAARALQGKKVASVRRAKVFTDLTPFGNDKIPKLDN